MSVVCLNESSVSVSALLVQIAEYPGVDGLVAVIVYWCTQIHKWKARIKKDYKTRYLGSFDTAAEAGAAYALAAREVFGEFARI